MTCTYNFEDLPIYLDVRSFGGVGFRSWDLGSVCTRSNFIYFIMKIICLLTWDQTSYLTPHMTSEVRKINY